MRILIAVLVFVTLSTPSFGQPQTPADELRLEIARLKEALARAEALLVRLDAAGAAAPTAAAAAPQPAAKPAPTAVAAAPQPAAKPAAVAVAPVQAAKPPAMNAPPKLPASDPENYKKTPPRVDVLLQARYEHFEDPARISTFSLRKGEIGLKGNIAQGVDFCLEVDLARTTTNDPYRRTYIRFSQFKHLHLKVGQEKAPIGLEELTSNSQIAFVERAEVTDRFAASEEMGIFTESNWSHFMVQTSVTNGGRRLYRDDNRNKNLTARVVWGPTPKWSFGAATMQGKVGTQSLDRLRYALEAKYGTNNIQGAQAEFFRAKDGTVWSTAYYAQAYWAKPMNRSWITHVMPAVRYEHIDRDDHARLLELDQVTLGIGFLFRENKSKLQFDWLKDVRSDTPRKPVFRAQYTVEF
jgi:hypothetical protein